MLCSIIKHCARFLLPCPLSPVMLLFSHPHLLFSSSLPLSLLKSHSLLLPGRAHAHLHPVAVPDAQESLSPASAAALAASIRRASPSSPVEFSMETTTQNHDKGKPPMPSSDFQRLCVEQLQLFRMVVREDAILSVYVRPAGSYIMNQLELRRVAIFPGIDVSESSEYVILMGNFYVVAGLKLAEVALSKQEMDYVPEYRALVIPLMKHPFIVGFLVAELPNFEKERNFDSEKPQKTFGIQSFKEDLIQNLGIQFSIEQKSRAIMISKSLATAYVMDQKALLVQQTSWQNNVRMNQLVEQIRGPLLSISSLAKMLSMYVKRTEVPYDIIEDIIIQGDHMKDTLRQIQDAVYLTKANIFRYNEDTLKKMNGHTNGSSNYSTPFLPDFTSKNRETNSLFKPDSLLSENRETNSVLKPDSLLSENRETNSVLKPDSLISENRENNSLFKPEKRDMELPMPPLWLVPLQQNNARPCDVREILEELVGAAAPLAYKQKRVLELSCKSDELLVAVEEMALRQALSNLIEGALLRTKIDGRVLIYAGGAPAGGALVVIDDDGPDMQYMTQMHALAPFGTELLGEGMVEDNMAWNFIAGMAIAREILESFGCVVRVISPRKADAGFGSGGTRVELWLPSVQTGSIGEDSALSA